MIFTKAGFRICFIFGFASLGLCCVSPAAESGDCFPVAGRGLLSAVTSPLLEPELPRTGSGAAQGLRASAQAQSLQAV